MKNQFEGSILHKPEAENGILSCSYLQGNQSCPESVCVEILRDGKSMHCKINADLLLCGLESFLDMEGSDVILTLLERLELLKRIQEERQRITGSYPVKTWEAWKESGLNSFEDFCFPGDTVDEELVNYFVNCLPPATFRTGCTQSGEPYSHEPDGNGRFCPTYVTFHRIDEDLWRFDGYCFLGENQNRVDRPSHLQQAVGRMLKEINRKGKVHA